MTKAFLLASALLISGAASSPLENAAIAAGAKGADAVKKERCEREAMLNLYMGKQRINFIRQCLARNKRPPGKAAAHQQGIRPSGQTGTRSVTPLGSGNPPSTSTGSTAPSNAAVAPSAPVIGSTGTSTTGSSATSTSGSSGSSIGTSGAH
ncbi:MAG TPA: hypothetical protein VJR71_18375 [Pseudolabrys sp.]|nr:hypothetical protein [Pseudolabrys sp.]